MWLLSKGKDEQARKSLQRLYGSNHDVEVRYQILVHTLETERNQLDEQASFIECFKGADLKRTLTVAFLMFSNGTIGSGFLAQNVYFLLTVGLTAIQAFDIGIGGFFLGCLAIALSWTVTDKIGRRRLYLTGLTGNTIIMALIGGLGFRSDKATVWGIAVLM